MNGLAIAPSTDRPSSLVIPECAFCYWRPIVHKPLVAGVNEVLRQLKMCARVSMGFSQLFDDEIMNNLGIF